MVKEKSIDCQDRLEQFLQHLEEARKLQNDILKYGFEAVHLYVEDVDGDWLEKWGEDEEEQKIVELVKAFLESDEWVAVKVRRLLQGKSLREITIELEKCLSFTEEQDRIFAIKNVLVDNLTARESNCDISDEIDLLDLAEELLDKLENIALKS